MRNLGKFYVPPLLIQAPIYKHQNSNNLQNTSTKPVPLDEGNSNNIQTPKPVQTDDGNTNNIQYSSINIQRNSELLTLC